MGLAHSPKIVTDGLVFALDTGNDKSYKGPVMTNIANQITQIGTGTSGGYSFTASTESVSIPTVGTMTAQVNSGFNNYPSVSTNCCPSLFYYGGLTVLPNTLYTYGILYKTTSGYSDPNFMYRYEYNNIGQYLTEQGVHSTTNRTHLGDGWYWAWGTFTTQPTAVTLQTYLFYYNYGTATDKVYVADVMITQGDYTKLHPRYWPDVNTSRATTSVLLDLTQKNTMTATSLTYANTGAISFNGSSDYISIPNSTSLQFGETFSVSVWINATSLSNRFAIFTTRIANPAGAWQLEVGTGNAGTGRIAVTGLGTWIWESSSNVISTDTWYNICYVKANNSTSGSMYLNGALLTPLVTTAYTISNNSDAKGLGVGTSISQFFPGRIAKCVLYNKALSATEVLQNFNALRGRFGL